MKMQKLWKNFTIAVFFIAVVPKAISQTRTQMDEWTLTCNEEQCVATQLLTDSENDLKYTGLLTKVQGSNNVVLRIIFPLGVYLPPGISLKIGNFQENFPMTVCVPNGCSSIIPINESISSQFIENEALSVRFYFSQARESEISFSTAGLTKVLQEVEK